MKKLTAKDKSWLRAKIASRCVATESGCLEWQGAKGPAGYGRLTFKQRWFELHRLAFVLYHRDLEDGEYVLHECDNRSCCNPCHLRAGSNRDNIMDAAIKGRMKVKLTPDKAREIHNLYGTKSMSVMAIAATYGITRHMVYLIGREKAWVHATVGYPMAKLVSLGIAPQ